MHTRIYKLYATASADTNAAAQVVFQRPGLITSILLDGYLDALADDTGAQVELSFSSTRQLATNDTVGPIAQASLWGNITTSGAVNNDKTVVLTNIAVPVLEGDRCYMHFEITGTTAIFMAAYLYVAESH